MFTTHSGYCASLHDASLVDSHNNDITNDDTDRILVKTPPDANSNETSVEGPTFLTKFVAHIFEMFDLKQVIQDIKQSKTTPATCYSCKFGITLLQHLLEYGHGREELAKLADTICVMLRVEEPHVCHGIVNVFKVRSLLGN